jgi:hypothetical protein
MIDFFSNTAANLVGTFVGVGLGLLTARVVTRREKARTETARLQRLIDRMYRSRALAIKPITPPRTADLDQGERLHYDRVTRAIFGIRDLIEAAANTFDPRAKAVPVLDEMYGAVLVYLNAIEVDHRDYVNESMRLREALSMAAAKLKKLHASLVLREPGGIATAG